MYFELGEVQEGTTVIAGLGIVTSAVGLHVSTADQITFSSLHMIRPLRRFLHVDAHLCLC